MNAMLLDENPTEELICTQEGIASTDTYVPPMRLTRAQATEIRRCFYADDRMTIQKLMLATEAARKYIIMVLCNQTHRADGPEIDLGTVMAIDRDHRFNIPADEVLGARIAALETGGVLGTEMVAETGDLDLPSAEKLLTGVERPDVKIFVPFQVVKGEPTFNENEVVYWRRRYQEELTLTPTLIAEMTGVNRQLVGRMLTGRRFGHIPGALSHLRTTTFPRGVPDEVALFIRLQYKPSIVTKTMLARYYKLDDSTVDNIVEGKRYKDLPKVPVAKTPKTKRKLTDSQVIAARIDFFSGIRTPKQIAESLGFTSSGRIYTMLIGERYADLPGVPADVMKALGPKRKKGKRPIRLMSVIRNRKRKPIPVRQVRLLDHDERADRHAYAQD